MTMNKEIGRIINLYGKKYMIVSKLSYEKDDYLYLMSLDKPVETVIAKSLKLRTNVIELSVINDKNMRKELYEKFLKSLN